mmetsp:Transcript_108795/g.307741  ORF Transcript_108795/g.307741 Transcript_108795/m.307741 type:complete len:343 (-) Transcript_108795:365-1393(-)
MLPAHGWGSAARTPAITVENESAHGQAAVPPHRGCDLGVHLLGLRAVGGREAVVAVVLDDDGVQVLPPEVLALVLAEVVVAAEDLDAGDRQGRLRHVALVAYVHAVEEHAEAPGDPPGLPHVLHRHPGGDRAALREREEHVEGALFLDVLLDLADRPVEVLVQDLHPPVEVHLPLRPAEAQGRFVPAAEPAPVRGALPDPLLPALARRVRLLLPLVPQDDAVHEEPVGLLLQHVLQLDGLELHRLRGGPAPVQAAYPDLRAAGGLRLLPRVRRRLPVDDHCVGRIEARVPLGLRGRRRHPREQLLPVHLHADPPGGRPLAGEEGVLEAPSLGGDLPNYRAGG